MPLFDLIAFDADDTLWHNERLYVRSQAGLADLLAKYGVSSADLAAHLDQMESRNIALYGYGVKSFSLSMLESAAELTGGQLTGQDVQAILRLAKQQLTAPVELLAGVRETVDRLAGIYRLMVITKGEPHEQEAKLKRSGLAETFGEFAVVSDKTRQSYAQLFAQRRIDPGRLVMVGNALRSDILPVLALGGHAVYVPYPDTWQHEAAEMPAPGTPRFHQIASIGELADLLESLESKGGK